MGKSWKIHYFDWAMFNSKLLVYQRVSDVLHGLVFVGKSVNICCVNYVQRVFWTTALPLWPSNCDIKGQLDKPRDGWGPSHGHRLAVWANLVMQPSNAAIYIYVYTVGLAQAFISSRQLWYQFYVLKSGVSQENHLETPVDFPVLPRIASLIQLHRMLIPSSWGFIYAPSYPLISPLSYYYYYHL